MLGFIAENYDQALTINDVAEHVKLNANYAMGIFQRVMQLTMKQYITAMRINHVRALLSDTDKSILTLPDRQAFLFSKGCFICMLANMSACRRNNTANLANSAARRFPAKDDISISQKNSLAVDNKQ